MSVEPSSQSAVIERPKELFFQLEDLWEIEFEDLNVAIQRLIDFRDKHVRDGKWIRLEIWPPEQNDEDSEHFRLIGVRHQTPEEKAAEEEASQNDQEYQLYKELQKKYAGGSVQRRR